MGQQSTLRRAAFARPRPAGRRRPSGGVAALVLVALLAALLSAVAPTTPVAADGNEAPGAPFAARSITAGSSHSCAILPVGRVKCWGSNSLGQLGQDSTANLGDSAGEMAALPAVNLGAGRTATAITAAGNHTCALLDNATIKCWGTNTSGQLGQDSTASLGDAAGEMAALPAVNLGAGRTATAITAGAAHTCALLDNATIKCWGTNISGQLGQDSTANLGDAAGEMAALPAVNLGAGRTATAVTAGDSHTCALLDNATIKCWGSGPAGQLGQDSTATLGDGAGEMAALPAVNLGAGRTATAVTAAAHTCALLDNATIKCWGTGFSGRLGQDSTAHLGDASGEMAALPAVNLGAGRTATAVTAGAAHTCALLDNATIKCWGTNTSGQLGQDSTANLGDAAGEMAALPEIDFGSDPASMSVALTADETSVLAGETIHYHLTVTNTGISALSGFTVSDPNAPNCVQAIAGLAAGANQVIDCAYTTTTANIGTYANTATIDTTQTAPVVSNTVNVTVTLPAGAGLVSGTVTETGSGNPIAGAVVAVLSTATFSPVAVATANGSGQYVAAPAAGSYFVYALDTTGAHTPGFSGAPTTVAVTAGNTTTADAALAATRGTLAGTVTDIDTGVADVVAMSVDLANGQPGAGDLTDGNGAYSIPGIPAGSRLLEFIDLTAVHSVEFYDNVPTPTGAQVLTITGAATTTANAELAFQTPPGTTAHLTGQITATGGGNLEGVAVLALRTSDFGLAAGDLTDGTGSYDIALDPGTYKLAFYDPSGTHLFEWHDNQPASGLGSAATVTATAGTPLATNAALTPTTGTVSGTVTESGSNANLGNVFVVAINPSGVVVGGTTTAANGTYTLTNLPVGNIRIRFVDLNATHTDEYYDNAPDFAGGTLVPITAGGATTGINAALIAIE